MRGWFFVFVPLHIHSEYSLQESPITIKDLITKAVSFGYQTLALTDHNTMAGLVDFYYQAKQNQLQPILGLEIDIRDRRFGDSLVLLAENNLGYLNLLKLASEPKPVSLVKLAEYTQGLICLVSFNQSEQASKTFTELVNILGVGNVFIEVLIDDNDLRNMASVLVKQFPMDVLVASQNIYYLEPEQEQLVKVMQAGKHNCKIEELDVGKPLRSSEQMKQLFNKYPQLIENTTKIAQRCQVKLGDQLQLPKLPEEASLTELAWDGAMLLYPQLSEVVKNRLEHELSVIESMGLSDYFLIVSDIVNYAKAHDIPVGPGRGSAAGSLVAYCLGITMIDPIKHNLLFERFLNIERQNLPDIDLDICSIKRDQLVDYVVRRFGKSYVAKIGAYGSYGAKAARTEIKKIIGAENDQLVQSLIGIKQYFSTHAAGLVITPEPTIHYSGVERDSIIATTQVAMEGLERLGVIKIDLLGLRNLSILADLQKVIHANNPKFTLEQIPLTDSKTYQLLTEAKTLGIFQLESEMFQQILPQFKVSNFKDLVALLALGRPGPLKQISAYIKRRDGQEPIQYLDPKLDPILKETYGLIVYQEQVMLIAHQIAGFSLEQADLFRIAISKKDRKTIKDLHSRFISGCMANGLDQQASTRLYAQIEQFADYAFNKAHSTAYAHITWNLAYLKTHHPLEFYLVQLKHANNISKIRVLYHECLGRGIKLLPPDVRYSNYDPVIEGDSLRIGFGSLKNIGKSGVEQIIRARNEKNFNSLDDFLNRVNLQERNKLTLAYAGAFDGLCDRKQLMKKLDSNLTEISDWELLQQEKEIVGIYISIHPVVRWKSFLAGLAPSLGSSIAGEISDLDYGQRAIHGEIVNLNSSHTFRIMKSNQDFNSLIQLENLVALFGEFKNDFFEVEWVLPLKPMLLLRPAKDKMVQLQQFLTQNKGDTPVILNIEENIIQVISPKLWLNISDDSFSRLEKLCEYTHWIDPWKSRYF